MSELMDQIEKKMPYRETDEYLDKLINRVTENALEQHSGFTTRWCKGGALMSAAAVALVVIGIGITVHNQLQSVELTTQPASGPIDEFLNTLTDDEVAMLPYYEIDEIPEY